MRELRLLSAGDGEQLTLPAEGSSAGQRFIGQVVVSEVVVTQEPADVFGQLVAADGPRCGGGLQRVLHDGLVGVGDEQDAKGGGSISGSRISPVDGLDVNCSWLRSRGSNRPTLSSMGT